MEKKKIFIVVAAAVLALCGSYFIINKSTDKTVIQKEASETEKINDNNQENIAEKDIVPVKEKSEEGLQNPTLKKAGIQKEDSFVTKTNLYNDLPASALPLSAISIISELPQNIKDEVLKISETNNIYMIQPKKDKLLVVSENPENIRHNVEFTEISLHSGQQIKTTLGYNDKMKDSQNDKWEYNESKQPVRHSKYDENGDLEFVEVWNYENDNPVKYEMKDGEGKVLSIRKETLENGTNLRVEHLLYDKDGKTRMNVSATYEGEDIKRFTYYNSDKINESGSVFSDYSDGVKTKEVVYTSDLKVKNSYTSEYRDGNREEIIKWDSKNKEVHKYLPEETDL